MIGSRSSVGGMRLGVESSAACKSIKASRELPSRSCAVTSCKAGYVSSERSEGNYIGLAPSDPSLEPYLAVAEELDVPVGFHTGIASANTPFDCCPKFRIGLGNPALIEDVLIRHPKLRVYLMHAGRPFLEETIASCPCTRRSTPISP